MTGPIERAVAGEIAPTQFAFDVLDSDRQSAGEQVIAVPTNRFLASEFQWVRVAPLGWPSYHNDVDR